MSDIVECVGKRKIILKVSHEWRPYNLWRLIVWRWLWEQMDDVDRNNCLLWARDEGLWPK